MNRKPDIPTETLVNWQSIVNLMARISQTPAGLIMRLHPGKSINVFVTSATEGNVWELGDECALDSGLYCEEVVKRRDHLMVTDANLDSHWDKNPDLEYGMSFYQGYPLLWPDGEVFGTICVLDTNCNRTAIDSKDIIYQFKKVVDGDLKMLVEIDERKQAQKELLDIQKQLEQRVQKRTKDLEDVNTALRILADNRESAKNELEESILTNINELILPYLQRLIKSQDLHQRDHYYQLIESGLKKITSSFSNHVVQKFVNLTPTELQVVNLIQQGKRTKEIATCLNIATSTIDFHRANIRKKVGLTDRRMSLQNYFHSA